MSSNMWSPPEGSTTFADTFSPTRHSYTDSQRLSSDGEDPEGHTRRLNISPSPSRQYDDGDDGYTEGDSIDEIDAVLNTLDDEVENAQQSRSQWSPGSYSSAGPTFSSATGTFTYSGTYTGSPSFVSLPTFSPRSPVNYPVDPLSRLSRITELTEESRPASTAFSGISRPVVTTPDNFRRSAFLAGTTSLHSRSSTEPTSDRTLPIPGRLGELIAVYESQSPGSGLGHSRTASTPGQRSSSPMFGTSQSTTTGYGYGSTTGYGSRPSSPSKSGSAFSGTHPEFRSSLLSLPVRPTTTSGFRSVASTTESKTQSYTTASFTMTPSAFSNTITQTGSYTTPNTELKTITGSDDTFTRGTVTPTAILRRQQSPPRSPLASVRNIVALWKERTPASARTEKSSVSPPSPSRPAPPPPPPPPPATHDEGLYGIRRRVEGARARMRESRGVGPSTTTPVRPTSQEMGNKERDSSSTRSGRSGRSNVFPPGFDLSEFSAYARSTDPPSHMGLLWYLNVHASPPYRWQRCQALLYPDVLLLSWLAPGGGRGIVALDLLNCTSVQSAPSPMHPIAHDDVGTIAARQQSNDPNSLPLMDMLVPFHMMYADGVERLAAESILERQKWVNRIWEAVNRPITVPDSVSVTRSPTGSIRTIRTIESDTSHSSNGSRSTVFVPPLSSIPDISDFQSSPGLSRRSSIVSSYHSRTVDDTVIQNQEYVYPGDRRVITPSRDSSLRRSGSLTALDDEFKNAIRRARGTNGFFGSPVTITSGSTLGKNILVTSPPTGGRLSDEDRFFSAGSDGSRSNVSSTYFSPTATPMTMSGTSMSTTGTPMTMTELTPATSATQVPPSLTFTPSYLRSGSDSELSFMESPSTLSRARVIRRRVASSARSQSSGYQSEVSRSTSDKENDDSVGGSRTPMGSYDSFTPGSGSLSLSGSGSYLDSRSRTPTGSYSGSERSGSGSYSGSRSYIGSASPTPSGGYTPGSGSGSFTLPVGTSSGIGDHTPISSSETGYDICPSSDLTDFTTLTTTATVTPVPLSPVSVAISEIPSAIPSEKYVTASQASTEYDTAAVVSSRASITSFESLPTIPSDYWTAASVSSYRTASEPSERSVYATPTDLPEIPSQVSTPVLAMPTLPPERGVERPPAYVRPILPVPLRQPIVPPPTRRSPSVISDLSPDEVPLPPSAPPPAVRPLPRTPTPVLSPELPLPTRPTSSSTPTPTPSPPSITESAQATPRVRPISAPSPSPSLSATPTPLSPSTITRDVVTPTSYLPPPSTESSVLTETLSLLSSLPPSTVQSTSVITPTSVAIVSGSTVSTLPPPPLVLPTSAQSSLSITTSISPTTLTQTSSSFVPPSPQPWASATDASYESSILHPSPSIRSVALGEGGEFSFETSILRPTGSPSSVGRMSTIPPSPTPAATATPYSPLPPLTPVPALPSSVSSATDIGTPTSLEFTSESSSLSRSVSVTSSSYLSESSLTPSEVEEEEEVLEVQSVRTVSTLLSTLPPSIRPSPSSSPSVIAVPSLPTPEGTVIMSITTPQGSGATEQSSLRTMPSVSAVTERDLGRDFDRMADEIRTYDQARGLEHQDLFDNVRALRDELQGLANYLHRTPSPATPVPHRMPPQPLAPETRTELVDRPIGGSSIISSVYPHVIEVEVPPGSGLTRSTSNASSVESYLSSHYSDEDLLEAEPDYSLRSPAVWEEEPSTESSRITSTSSISSSPLTRSSELESEATAMPQAPDFPERALQDIRDQLRALEDSQNAARDLLEGLQTRPEDHTGELAERLQRIENLIQTLMDQGHPRGPELPQAVPPSRTVSISDSTDSLRRLRSILSDLVSPPDIETQHMPMPTAARAGPSVAQQLDDILSSTQMPQPTPSQLPHVEPFVYRPTDRGTRARSASPTSMELPPRSQTVPLFYPISQARPLGRSTAGRRLRREPSESESLTPPPPPRRSGAEPERVYGDLGRRGEPQRDAFHVGPGPTPQPVFGDLPRPTTAPPDFGSPGRDPVSWYRQPQQPKPSTSAAPGPPAGEPPAGPAGVRYMPMPAGPTVVQLPPLFDSLMEILRENRLAQLATVDQQRELMRYMRGLNEWLERDVQDRQDEIRRIYAMVERLAHNIQDMRGRRPTPPSSPSTESETAIRYNFPTAQPQFPGIPPGFQPYPVDRPVFPPVIPDVPPVMPQPQPTIIVQPATGVVPGPVPAIPRLDYHPGGPGPQPSPHIPEDHPPFIPPSRASTGTPRRSTPIPVPYPSMGAGQTIVHRPYSPSSSRDSSTESTRRSGRRRSRSPERSRRYDSRESSISPRHAPSSRSRRSHLAVTNGPGGPPIHIVPPSVAGTAPPGQPIVIMQPPTQPVYQPSLTPGGFGVPPSMQTVSEMGPMPATPIVGGPAHIPVTDMGYPPPMSVGPGMPMSGMQGVPVSTAFPPMMQPTAPVIIRDGSPESRRSRSRSSSRRRRRDEARPPPQPQTVVIERPRSPEMPPIAAVPSYQPGVLPGMIPGSVMPGVYPGPPIMMRPESPRSEHRRSRSRSRDRVILQPQQPMLPTVLPSATQGPVVIPTPGVPMFPGGGPPIVMHPESRSHSRSPRRPPAPVILQQPLPSQQRYRSPRRSYSSERRRRHRSPRYASYSPERRRHRSPSYYDRDDRRRDYDRHRGRSPSYHSRSPPPRRGRRSPISRSRSPPIHHLPPTAITGLPPTHYPRTHPPPTHYTPTRHSPHIQVIDIPTSPRGRLLRRDRSFSPESPGFSLSPRHYPGRRPAARRRDDSRPPVRRRDDSRPPGSRRSISSPPYAYSDRSASPLPPRERLRRPLRRDEREGSPYERPRRDEREGSLYERPRRDEREGSPYERPPRRDEREGSPYERPPRRDEREGPPRERSPLRRDEREGSPHERSPLRRDEQGVSPSPLSTPERAAERMPRGPIKVTVPTLTSKPPRVLAEARPKIPVAPGPSIGYPGEEEPSSTPLPVELEEREEGVQPTTTRPIPPERRAAVLPTRPTTELGYPPIEDPREQIDALNRAADRLQMIIVAAEEAEDRREGEYRQHEEDRMRLFLDHEAQRNEEARQRNEAIWRGLESRLAALPPVPAAAPIPEKPIDESAEIESIKSAAQRAASEHASDVMEVTKLEREEFARERELEREEFAKERELEREEFARERDQLVKERAQLFDQLREEKDHRIKALEDEISRLRADSDNERQQRFAEEADLREQERQERIAHDNEMRTQLADLTNLVQNLIEEKKATGDARYAEKQARRQDKEAQMIELRDMIQKIHDDNEADRTRCEDDKRDIREAIREVLDRIEDLPRQNVEQRELFQSLSDSWRADCERHHEEILEAVRSAADKQVRFNVQGYLDEFSQALATEVRMLLGEVGKIREERRALQHEIGDLLSTKAKYGPGGEYEPDWRPPGPPPSEGMGAPGGPGGPPPPGGPDGPPPGDIPPIKPAWRTVHQRPKKKKKDTGPSTSAPPAPPAPMPPQRMVPRFGHPAHEDVRQQVTGSWATWQPDRNAVTPPSHEPTLMVPGRQSPGLFGPRTPSTSQSLFDNRR